MASIQALGTRGLNYSWTPNKIALLITTCIILINNLIPNSLSGSSEEYFAMLLVLAGVMHGASDYFMYKILETEKWSLRKSFIFYFKYLFAIIIYAVVWYLLPSLALLLFIFISVYHFGQSNLSRHRIKSPFTRRLAYLIWGGFVTLTPLVFHLDQTNAIISEISGLKANLSPLMRNNLVALLFILNICLLIFLALRKQLSLKSLSNEITNLIALILLFINTPLLLGFAIYFLFWHSTYAIADQITLLKIKVRDFNFKAYLFSIALMSTIALLGMSIGFIAINSYSNLSFGWGMFFLFISLITLPHFLLVDSIYES